MPFDLYLTLMYVTLIHCLLCLLSINWNIFIFTAVMFSLLSLFIAGMLSRKFYIHIRHAFIAYFILIAVMLSLYIFYSCQALITIMIFTASMLSLHSSYFKLLCLLVHFIFSCFAFIAFYFTAVLLTISVLLITLLNLSGL